MTVFGKTSPLPSVCGHNGDTIVRYSSHESQTLHTICNNCYVTEVQEQELDIQGGTAYAVVILT